VTPVTAARPGRGHAIGGTQHGGQARGPAAGLNSPDGLHSPQREQMAANRNWFATRLPVAPAGDPRPLQTISGGASDDHRARAFAVKVHAQHIGTSAGDVLESPKWRSDKNKDGVGPPRWGADHLMAFCPRARNIHCPPRRMDSAQLTRAGSCTVAVYPGACGESSRAIPTELTWGEMRCTREPPDRARVSASRA